MHNCRVVAVALGVALLAAPAPADEDISRLLTTINGVTREGAGNENAAPAWKTLVGKGVPALLPTLAAINDDNPTGANWLRTAVEAIAQNEATAGRKLKAADLEGVVLNLKLSAAGRRLAYELLVAQDPDAKARLLPKFLDDKSPELRRDAIAFQLDILEKAARPTIKADLEKLFGHARDKDQVDMLAKKVNENGGKANITEHLAFVTHVALAGPFDAPQSKGFALVHPPETATDTKGTFKGKDNVDLKWTEFDTADKYGVFDLNKLVGKHKDAITYALAVIVAENETPCEIRVACPTSLKIFLNGKELYGRDEYHHGDRFDANVGRGTLKKGENVIVLKVCQNNQTEQWAQKWQFQMRVCDGTGGPLPGVTQLVSGKKVKLGFIPEGTAPKEEKK